MDFYFDESKHPGRGDFVVGAFVGTRDDPPAEIAAALHAEGLVPGTDEYKSCAKMSAHPEQARLRDRLRQVLLWKGQIALVILPYSELPSLGKEALSAFKQLIAKYSWPPGTAHRAFFDQQVFRSIAAADRTVKAALLPSEIQVHVEQDSRQVLELQLADLAAHTCSMMLLEQLGLLAKQVKAGENSGYDPDLDISLGFELWAGCRYSFFSGRPPRIEEMKSILDHKVQVSGYGLFISEGCPPTLRAAAEARFGEMYLGCIH